MIIQIAIIGFILFVVWRIVSRFRIGDITGRELTIWLVFWLVVAGAVLWPQQTDVIAQLVGVERGADLLVYLSILALFFLAFKILVRLEKLDKDITTVVRHEALKEKSEKNE